jgi:NADPH:quinone reductase-like Zn-dependent oxidoreductase
MIGALTGAADFNPISVFMKAVRLQGIFVGSRSMFEDMLAAIEVAKLQPIVDRVFAFEDARDAFEYMRSGAHFGKVVIKI